MKPVSVELTEHALPDVGNPLLPTGLGHNAANPAYPFKNTDNRFGLESRSQGDPKTKITTTWRVRSYYDFEPFAKAPHVTHIPLGPGMTLVLPDGLSHYMTVIGIAKEFWYYAEWPEDWAPAPPAHP